MFYWVGLGNEDGIFFFEKLGCGLGVRFGFILSGGGGVLG